MENIIIFYEKLDGEKPVEDFVESLPVKHKAKVYWEIKLLERYGRDLKEPYVKNIKGEKYKGLWELRIKFAGYISRIFYSCWKQFCSVAWVCKKKSGNAGKRVGTG
jgi:hypothetical protein